MNVAIEILPENVPCMKCTHPLTFSRTHATTINQYQKARSPMKSKGLEVIRALAQWREYRKWYLKHGNRYVLNRQIEGYYHSLLIGSGIVLLSAVLIGSMFVK